MRQLLALIGLLLIVALGAAAARADDWTATKLRGNVLANDVHSAGQWVHLKRGDIVSDARVIRTMAGGNVVFTRAAETISMGPNTEAQIVDKTGRRYTTVMQHFGKVAIEAQVQNVQHFAVETPYLIAVVKGTQFTVSSDKAGSRVAVVRGLVAVTNLLSKATTMVPAGQQLTETAAGRTTISGKADQAATHPIINGVVEDAVGTTGDVLDTTSGTVDDLLAALAGNTGGLVDTSSTIKDLLTALTANARGFVVDNGTLPGGVGGTLDNVGSTTDTTLAATSPVGSIVGSTGGTVNHVLSGLGL